MRISLIEIENFKGIGGRQLIDLKPITLLFGPNSAGKSTILQSLHYIREILERHKIYMRGRPDYYKQMRLKQPEKVNAKENKRKAAKLQRIPCWLTPDDFWMIEQAYDICALRTKMTGIEWHVDHIIPLQGKLVSGLHMPYNLQVIPASINTAKGNKFEV
jgi:predicted ATP-dependent endonuclease of OLD family